MTFSIQTKVLTTAILLVLLTTTSISIAYYVLQQQEVRRESRDRIHIALDFILNDLDRRQADMTMRVKDFLERDRTIYRMAQRYSADPSQIRSGQFLLGYFFPSIGRLEDLGSLIQADRLLVYGADQRLLMIYQRQADQVRVGGYLITENGADTFFSMDEPSHTAISLLGAMKSTIPERPLPAGITHHFENSLPASINVHAFREGTHLGMRILAPLFHQTEQIGVLVGETYYTQSMVDMYANLSKTDVNVFTSNTLSLGTLAAFDTLPTARLDRMLPCQQIPRHTEPDVFITPIGQQDYYQGQCALTNSDGVAIGAIITSLSQRVEKDALQRTVTAAMTITLVTICLASAALSVIVITFVTRPIDRLMHAMHAFELGDFDVQAPTTNRDEIGKLATAFNHMGRQLKENFHTSEALVLQLQAKNVRLHEEISDREKMEAMLAVERNLLRTLIDNMPDSIYVKDHESRFLVANTAVAGLMGTTPDRLIGKKDLEFFQHPEARQYYVDEQHIMESGIPLLNKEEVVYDAEKKMRWLLTTKVPLRNAEGRVTGIIGIGHDITERKQIEERLIQLKRAVETMPIGVTITDLQGHILFTNPTEAAMHGYSVEELQGENVRIFAPPARQRPLTLERISTVEGMRRESLNVRKNGSIFPVWLMSEVVKNFQGDPIAIVTSSEDITERKAMERAMRNHRDQLEETVRSRTAELVNANTHMLREIRERKHAENELEKERNLLRTIIDSLPDYIYVKDTQCRFMLVNATSSNNNQREMIGRTDFDILPHDFARRFYADDQWVMKNGRASLNQEEPSIYPETGKPRWFLTTKVPLRDPQGTIFGLVGVSRDITQQKQRQAELVAAHAELQQTLEHLKHTQSQLIQSEKMAALGQLIAGVAHEINTPLGAIRASIENIVNALDESLHKLPDVLCRLPEEERHLFFELLSQALSRKTLLTSREERNIRRTLRRALEDEAVAHADSLADTLVDMGIYDSIQPFLPLFSHDDNTHILRMAYNLCTQKHNSANILQAVERVSKIVFALKHYAHQQDAVDMIDTHLAENIEVVLTLYHNQLKHGIEVAKHYAEVPTIRCYPDELTQVWTNIIHNAIQAMDGKGTLDIAIAPKEQGIVVTMTDSGVGIPDAVKDRIFEPFVTSKAAGEGSGLGLDICRQIIEKHQGTITAESRPGHTTFAVWLPVERRAL